MDNIKVKKLYHLRDDPGCDEEIKTDRGLLRKFTFKGKHFEVLNSDIEKDDSIKILREIIMMAVRDFEFYADINNRVTANDKVMWATACGFIFDSLYAIDWGDLTLTFEDIFHIVYPDNSCQKFKRVLVEKVLKENPLLEDFFYLNVLWRTL